MIAVQVRPSQVHSRPAPLKGMNTADLVTALDGGFAQRIDNFIVRSEGLTVRPGYRVHETGTGAVTSLMAYGVAPVARRDGDWTGDVIANPGGMFLFAANGSATPQVWNGSTWADCSISGVSPVALVAPVVHAKRVFAIQSGTLTLWYLPVDSFGGQAYPIYLGPMAKHGGSAVALCSVGDTLYIATTAGELLLYRGMDPNDAKQWSFVGAFKIDPPVSKRCFAKSASGAMIACTTGLYPLPKVLGTMESKQDVSALSAPIAPTYLASGASGVIESPSNDLTAVLTSTGLLVRSGDTDGWSRLLGFDATAWIETANGLYFGDAAGEVYKITGTEDIRQSEAVNRAIGCVLVDSFSKFGARGRKRFTRLRPHFTMGHPYKSRVSMLMDYKPAPATWEAQYDLSSYWLWPEVDYPMMPALWMRPQVSRTSLWRGTSGRGETGALVLGMSVLDSGATFIGCDYAFETGGDF